MKKIFLVAIACCIAAAVSAQIKLTLVLNATPPAQLSEWGTRREVLMLIVAPPPGFIADFKIKTEIKTSDGTVIGTTDLASAPVFTAGSTGNLILTAADVMPLDKMIFTGKYKSSLQRTGKLPSDTYTMCVTAVRPVDYTPMSPPECKTFYLASMQLPILTLPYNEQVLDAKAAQTAITFRWTALSPRTTMPVSYRLQIFEVLEKQNPVQALRSNMPLLDKEVKGTTQYIWRPQLAFHTTGTWDGDCTGGGSCPRFVWTVQTLDDHGLPVTQTDGSGEGRSEPIIFYVGNPGKMKAKEKGNRSN